MGFSTFVSWSVENSETTKTCVFWKNKLLNEWSVYPYIHISVALYQFHTAYLHPLAVFLFTSKSEAPRWTGGCTMVFPCTFSFLAWDHFRFFISTDESVEAYFEWANPIMKVFIQLKVIMNKSLTCFSKENPMPGGDFKKFVVCSSLGKWSKSTISYFSDGLRNPQPECNKNQLPNLQKNRVDVGMVWLHKKSRGFSCFMRVLLLNDGLLDCFMCHYWSPRWVDFKDSSNIFYHHRSREAE